MNKPSFGADISKKDKRTIKHNDLSFAALPNMKGGYDYAPLEITNQHKVGICTAISLIQNANKSLDKKFSADFQYLLQKKFIDKNWEEGSSVFSAMKVGKNFGFLLESDFPYITEDDRELNYGAYITKLKAVSSSEITRLLTLCRYKLSGYAQVDIDPASISKAINSSKAGIICRYNANSDWYTALDGTISWETSDINPLRNSHKGESGHAIIWSKYDFSTNLSITLANTWSMAWNRGGLGDTSFNTYPPTEVWVPYYNLTEEQQQEIKDQIQSVQLTLIDKLKQLIDILRGKLNGVVKSIGL